MRTNRNGVTENAFTNIDNAKFSQNFDHIFNREKCQCEEFEEEINSEDTQRKTE